MTEFIPTSPLTTLEMCVFKIFDSQEAESLLPSEVHEKLYNLVVNACSLLPLTGSGRLYKLVNDKVQQIVHAERLRLQIVVAQGIDQNDEIERSRRNAYTFRRMNALVVFRSLNDYSSRFTLPMIEDVYSSMDYQDSMSQESQSRELVSFTDSNIIVDEEKAEWERQKLNRSEAIPFQWAHVQVKLIEGQFPINIYKINNEEVYQPANEMAEVTLNEVKRVVFRLLTDSAPEGYMAFPADIWIGICPKNSLKEQWDLKYMFGLTHVAALYKTDTFNYAKSIQSAIIHYSRGQHGGYQENGTPNGTPWIVYIAWRFTICNKRDSRGRMLRTEGDRHSVLPDSGSLRSEIPTHSFIETPHFEESARCISAVFSPSLTEVSVLNPYLPEVSVFNPSLTEVPMSLETRIELYDLVDKICNTSDTNNGSEYLYQLFTETVQLTIKEETLRRQYAELYGRRINEFERSLRSAYTNRRNNALIIFRPLNEYASRMQLPRIEQIYFDLDRPFAQRGIPLYSYTRQFNRASDYARRSSTQRERERERERAERKANSAATIGEREIEMRPSSSGNSVDSSAINANNGLTSTEIGDDAAAGDDLGQNAFSPLQAFRADYIAKVGGLGH
jgi:hypothetical protein